MFPLDVHLVAHRERESAPIRVLKFIQARTTAGFRNSRVVAVVKEKDANRRDAFDLHRSGSPIEAFDRPVEPAVRTANVAGASANSVCGAGRGVEDAGAGLGAGGGDVHTPTTS